MVPREFSIAICRFFDYKIEAGKLYKKHLHEWIIQDLDELERKAKNRSEEEDD